MRIANRTILPKFPDLVRIYFATTVCLSPHFNEHEVNFHMQVEKVEKIHQKVVKIYLKGGAKNWKIDHFAMRQAEWGTWIAVWLRLSK